MRIMVQKNRERRLTIAGMSDTFSSHSMIQRIGKNEITAIVNTEVIQEILYRYQSLKNLPLGLSLAKEAIQICSFILPVTATDLSRALDILEAHPQIQTRDALHAATMISNGIEEILSTDSPFDLIPDIKIGQFSPRNFSLISDEAKNLEEILLVCLVAEDLPSLNSPAQDMMECLGSLPAARLRRGGQASHRANLALLHHLVIAKTKKVSTFCTTYYIRIATNDQAHLRQWSGSEIAICCSAL
jgi:predicted nucleic acid-binding protein